MKKSIAVLFIMLFCLLAAFVPAAAEGEPADVPVLATADEVAAFVREALSARKAAIRFKADSTAAAGATLAKVCAHTGNGKAGDYLRLSLNYVMPKKSKDTNGVYTLRPIYYTTAEQEAAVDAYVETVVAGCTAQDATEKARYLYDYLCENVTFDLENLYNDEDVLKYTAYGAVVNGRAVCQGFATLYYKLALAAGLECRIVTGKRGDVAHAWNIVKVDDLWYHVDVSSGAQVLDNPAYFMKRLFDDYTINYGDETATEIQGYSFVLANDEDTIVTGDVDENFSYALNKTTGVFVLSGTGKMPKNRTIEMVLFSAKVKSAVISEGITSFAGTLFTGCKHLERLSLPSTLSAIEQDSFRSCCVEADAVYLSEGNETFYLSNGCLIDKTKKKLVRGSNEAVIPDDGSVKSIGEYAFNECEKLTEICIPAEVTSISCYAFYNCSALTDLHLSEGLVTICREAFGHCYRLKQLALPSTVARIDYSAFDFCRALESITVEEENKTYCSINNCLIDIKPKALITGCSNSVIPDNGVVTQIGRSDIVSQTIGYLEGGGKTDFTMGYAFNGCSNLKSIIIPDGITFVSGFNGCGLTEVEFADSVTEIRGFQKCNDLRSIHFSNKLNKIGVNERFNLSADGINIGLFTYRCGYAFYECRSLTEIELPDSVRVIYGFYRCMNLTSVTIPPYCQVVGAHSFDDCDKLKEITILSRSVDLNWNTTWMKLQLFSTNTYDILDTWSEGCTRSSSSFNYDNSDITINGFTGSTAETYAKNHKRPFVSLCPKTNAPHNTEEIGRKEPGCQPVSSIVKTVCVDCGLQLSSKWIVTPALDHNPGEPVPENVVAATCTAEGTYDNVTYCTRCGKLLSSTAEKIAMTPHTDNDRNGYCDDCDAYICEHPETSLQNAKAAACLETGYSGDTVCMWCGVTLEYGVTLAATGHSPAISKPEKDATCLDAGMTAEYACSVCSVVTDEARPTPVVGHADSDKDGLCDVCLAPTDCKQFGRCGSELFWYADKGNLVISGSGASGELAAVPWESCAGSIDCVYLRDSVTAMDGAGFAACPNLEWVFAPAGATVSRCEAPVLYYSDTNGAVTVSGRDGVPAMDLPALVNAASVLSIDRTVASLRFARLSLHAVDGGEKVVYDILKNGKIVDEKHYRLPSGTELTAFSMKPLGYANFNSAFAAIQDHPDRNLILSLSCNDMLPSELKNDGQSYTEQFVLHFVDEPETPDAPAKPDEPNKPEPEPSPIQKGFERFQATLAAILSVFKSIFKIFKRK